MDNSALFTQLYEDIYKDLYRFAFYTLRDKHDAEDVVSETVLSAYEQFTKLRELSSFRPWIFAILANKCKRRLKSYVTRSLPLDEDILTYDSDMALTIDLQNVLLTLDDEDRLIVSLSIYGGYNSKEIAHTLKKNSNTIRSKLSRSLGKLQKLLEQS